VPEPPDRLARTAAPLTAARVSSREEDALVAAAHLVEGREAFARRAWGTAYERLRAVGINDLASDDLGSLAIAA
jgi:hypothetical protein